MIQQTLNGRAAPDFGPTMAELVDSFAKAWVDDHANASKDAANKAGVRHLLNLLAERCRAGLHDLADQLTAMPPAEAEALALPCLRGIDRLAEAQRDLESNVALALLLDNLAIQWAADSQPQAAGR